VSASAQSVLVVEDEASIASFVSLYLKNAGFEVRTASNGAEALTSAQSDHPSLIVLDLMLPDIDGIEICRRIRQKSEVPILMLTARDEVEARVAGLDAGADDYVVKPFALAELLARLRALLRRTTNGSGETLHFADLALDPATREVKRGGQPIELTRTEFSLLELFLLNPRQVLTRSLIFERVWGYDFGLSSNSLDVYIGYLRRKTETGGKPRLIQTVRGVGYALREP
jgi:two-component system, OmpR family, response regulator MprA